MTQERTAEKTPMGSAEWENLQKQIYLFAGLIARLDLNGFIEKGEHADAIAPYVDPTLYIAKHKDLERVLKVARALQKVQTTCAEAGLVVELA